VLSGNLSWFLLVLFILKLAATSLTLGSGASGGVFSPALYMGATLGGVYGLAMQRLFSGLPINPAAFAVAGMAGVVGGSTGASLAAVVMIFEMTQDYTVIIPMTMTVALSYGIRKMLLRESIYTLKLTRRGHHVPDALQANLYHLRKAREIMDTQFLALPAEGTFEDFTRTANQRPEVACLFLVEGPEGPVGFLTRDSASLFDVSLGKKSMLPIEMPPQDHRTRENLQNRMQNRPEKQVSNAINNLDSVLPPPQKPENRVTLADLADRRFVTVVQDTLLLDVMTRLRAAGASVGVVTDGTDKRPGGAVCGVITKQQIASAVIDGTELFAG